MKVAIVDYGVGNTFSVTAALQRLGAESCVTSDPRIIRSADRVILPGVGAASTAMSVMKARALVDVIRSLQQPVLGICLGMQLLCTRTQENNAQCLGLIDSEVLRFDGSLNVPHVGWNALDMMSGKLFEGIHPGSFVYFVHSFYAPLSDITTAYTEYGNSFSAAIEHDNFFGVQFHPEKSGQCGAAVINNFLRI